MARRGPYDLHLHPTVPRYWVRQETARELVVYRKLHETNSEWLGSKTMMERWWCIDCEAAVELNVYGRGEHCDSDAVDSMERIPLKAKAATAQIEALLASSVCGSN